MRPFAYALAGVLLFLMLRLYESRVGIPAHGKWWQWAFVMAIWPVSLVYFVVGVYHSFRAALQRSDAR